MKKLLLFSWVFVMSVLHAWGQASCTANDICTNAYTLTQGTTCSTTTFSTTNCIDEGNTSDCTLGQNGNSQKSIWFKFVATATTATVIVDGNTGFDAVLGVVSSCGSATRPTGGTCVDAVGSGGTETRALSGLTIGNTYFVSVYDYSGTAGTGTICVFTTPVNDVCSGATTLSVGTSCSSTSFSIAEYIDEGATGDCGIGTIQNTLWFKFVASATSATVMATPNTGSDFVIGAITTCGTTTRPTGGTCANIGGDGVTETLSLTSLTPGTTYYVTVHEYNADATGTGSICVVGPPANDLCSGAVTLTPSSNSTCSPILGTTLGATDNNETGDCDTGTEKAVWYKFVATSATHEVFVTGTTGFNPVVQVLNACGSSTNPTGGACVDVTGDGGKEVIYLSGLTIGNTYQVQVHDYNGDVSANSTFNICVTTPSIPTCGTNPTPTDACSGAPLINSLESFCGTTSTAPIYTPDTGMSFCGSIENNSYFKFVAASTEVTLNFNVGITASCSNGIQIALYSGSCGSLNRLGCISPSSGAVSAGVFNVGGLTVGQTYYVMIDGFAGQVCSYALSAVSGIAAVCNDCTKAACATNSIADDYYTLETETATSGNWNAFGAIAASGTPYTANGTSQGPNTVCTDIMPTSSSFIGFDYLVNALGTSSAITEIKNEGTFTLIGVTQEISAGVCTTLVPSGTNAFGMPEFNNTGGTPGVTAGAFDSTKPMTVCLSYSLPTSCTQGGTVSGFTVMGYGCAVPTGITLGATGVCSGSTYTKTLTINFDPTDLPTPAVLGGTNTVSLTVNGQVFAITTSEQIAGSKTITLTGLNADGASVNLEAYFTVNNACKYTLNSAYTAPTCVCAAPPSVSIVESSVTICGVTTFNYTVANGPATLSKGTGTGTLSTTSLANGTGTFTYTPSGGDSGNTFTITGSIADPDGAGSCVASSDAVTVTVNPGVTVTIAPTDVYQGDRTFVASTNVVSGTITYIFKKNGATQQSSTSSAWSATGLLQNDVITCEISVAGGACASGATATSNSVTVKAPLTPNYCSALIAMADVNANCGASTTIQSTLRSIYEVKQTSCDAIAVTSPTAVTLGDDQVTTDINIGFNFDFFGTPYSACRIHSNGIVSFGGQTYTGYTAVTIPNGTTAPNNYIAGFYTDIHPGCGGSVTYKTIGTAPNRQFVVTYTDIEPYLDGCNAPSTNAVSFQIVLEETTNLVRIITIKVPSTFLAGFTPGEVANATQGIEAGDGSIAFTTPGRNWQVWNNPGLTPAFRDCTTFGPVNYTSSFVDWKVGGSQVSTTNPYTFNPTSTQTYTATWNINGTICTDDIAVNITNSPTLTLETATNSSNCLTPDGTIPLTLTNTANGTYTLSYQKDGTPQTANVTVTNGAAVLSGLGAGIYSNFSVNIGGCIANATGSRTITVTLPTIALGTATNSTSCSTPDGTIPLTFTSVPDGTYTLSYTKDGVPTSSSITVSTAISTTQVNTGSGGTSESTTYGGAGNTNITVAVPSLPAGAVITSVGTKITYTSTSPSYRSELRARVTPPVAFGGAQSDLQPSILSSSGTVTGASIGSWGTNNPAGNWLFEFKETVNDGTPNPDATISNVTITIAYNVPGGATLTGLGAGTYSNFSITALGCTGTNTNSVAITAPATPTASGVTICQDGSGSLTSSYSCGTGFTNATNTISGSWNGATDPTANRPNIVTNSNTCGFNGSVTRNYSTIQFQVSVTGTYIFEMANNASYDGMGYIYTGSFTPGTCGTWVRGDDDDATADNEPRLGASGSGNGTMTLTAGVTYVLVSTTYSASSGTYTGSYSWTVTPPSGGSALLSAAATIQWYTASSGGSAIGSGSPFNPVGVAGSGLANTNTPGSTVYYAACSNNTVCRTAVNFVINPNLTPTLTLSPFNIFSASQTITATAANTGGGTVTYTFKKNTVTQQTGASNIWNATGLVLGDLITCDISIAGGTCLATPPTATSNTAIVRPIPTPSGVRGNTLTFNGSNQSVSVPDMDLLDMTNNYTIEVWAKFNSIGAGTQAIISKNTGSNNGYYLGRNGSALVFDGLSTAGSVINATDWHHIAVVNDNGTRRLYVNGWEQALSGTAITVAANTQAIGVGYDANTNTYFNGNMDEVRIWNAVRSQFTLRENMHLVLSGLETDLISYYQFNQSSGTSLTDIISQNHGALQNSPAWATSHANVGRGTSNTLAVNSAGLQTFVNNTMCKLNFSGTVPMGDIVVSRVEGLPAGVNLVTTNSIIRSVYTRYYWVINNFGTNNTALTITPTFILGPNQISPLENLSDLKMDKRPTNQDIAWTAYNAQSFVNFATGEVTFSDIDGFSEFVIHSELNSPLSAHPLTLAGERKDDETVKLDWKSNADMNCLGFEVQVSEDNQRFETVTTVNSKSSGATLETYTLLIPRPTDAYYRIKRLDGNNQFAYSPTVFVAGNEGDLIVFPNPTKDIVHIRLGNTNRAKERMKLKLYDQTGKLLFETDQVWEKAEEQLQNYLLQMQASGQYLLNINTRGRNFKKKIQVIR